MYLLIH